MPDPWLEGDDLKKHEEEVVSHPLTKEAEALKKQEEDLAKEAEKRREEYDASLPEVGDPIRPAQDSGYAQDAANSGIGPSGESQQEPPAGNVESNQPTQEEVEKKAKEDAEKSEDDGDLEGKTEQKKANQKSRKP